MKKLILVLMFTVVLIGMGTTKVMAVPYFTIEDGGGGGGSCDYSVTSKISDTLYYRDDVEVTSFTDFEFNEYRQERFRTTTYYLEGGICKSSSSYSYNDYSITKDQSIFTSNDTVSIDYDYTSSENYEMKLFDGDILIVKNDGNYYGISSFEHYEIRDLKNSALVLPNFSNRYYAYFFVSDNLSSNITCYRGPASVHVMPTYNNSHSEANDDNIKYKCQKPNTNESYEIIVDGNGNVVNDDVNMGTYNYYDSGTSSKLHRINDVLPWLIFGNTREDYSSSEERFSWYANKSTDLRYYSGTYFDTELVDGYDIYYGMYPIHYNYALVYGVPFTNIDTAVNDNNS